ncbi:MAG: efflux RND transporter periplasmic adaptor subunit [Candidatus Aminicenantes bacterium]|nr:efflux RND transporter periplasmic adaptor subunit [Candidatus Aminicenantes bacterium]
MKRIINTFKELWKSSYRQFVIILIVVAFLLGFIFRGGSGKSSEPASHRHGKEAASTAAKEQVWTCSMHPQIRQPKPGQCPLCGMDLVPVEGGGEEELGPRQLKLSPGAIKLAAIQTAPVERRFVASNIRMVGKVTQDETRVRYITSRVPGRLDRLYVDYTGITVRKGDHLVSLYSPQLITAQQELLQALKTFKKFGSGKSTVAAAREKLKLWGIPPEQIRAIENRGKTTDHLTIYSPMSGIVIHKNAVEGMYVKTGSKIYTIADLSNVWIKLDAYESDLTWIRYGQTVEFETEAYPGEMFKGRISFIDPVLNSKTHTIKVRVNVPNPQYKLKPGMFVHAVVRSKLSVSGKVMDPELAGKWISPMHPEVIKDRPGKCDVCGMPLVKAEKLGYIAAVTRDNEAPLVIPASAPLVTGTRAVVYVAVTGKEGIFEGKEIVLGPRAGDYYLVKEGLKEGEQVVINGAFKIDSDLQIQAKPSMMSPEGGAPAPGHQHGHPEAAPSGTSKKQKEHKHEPAAKIPSAFKTSIDVLASAYFDIQQALSSDSLAEAKQGADKLLKALKDVDMKLLTGSAHMDWMKRQKILTGGSRKLVQAGDIEAARVQFEVLTEPLTQVIKTFGSGKTAIYRFHCPMAFDKKGAYWLQKNEETRNPYFGASMLLCKDSVEPLIKEKKEEK